MILTNNLSKTYRRDKKEALKDVSLHIKKGEFTALLGQNGAGKSTLINILAGNVKKSAGMVRIGGFDLDRDELKSKKIIGVVPQEITTGNFFTVDEVLQAQSGYFGLKNNREYIDELLEALSLKDKRRSMARDLSGGMKRRLIIAKALVHKPEVFILDEPTAGVDIELRHSMYDFLNKLHERGTTIILTTHYLEEAEKLCKRVIIIDKGRVIADSPTKKLIDGNQKKVRVVVNIDKDLTKDETGFLDEFDPVIEDKSNLVLSLFKPDLSRMIQMLYQRKLEFSDLTIEKKKLEDVYLDLVGRQGGLSE